MPIKGCYEDLKGKKFNRLTAIEFLETDSHRRTYWLCKCDCGNTTRVLASHLKNGHTKSCGCRLQEINNNMKHLNYKNGLSKTRLGRIYYNMVSRCYRQTCPEYNLYGGKGVKICDEWVNREKTGFVNFCNWSLMNGYSDNLTIDRIDVNGNYEPSNCRWVDNFVQANNKTNTHRVIVNGELGTVSNLARKFNISYYNLLHYAKGGKNMKYPHLKIEVANG